MAFKARSKLDSARLRWAFDSFPRLVIVASFQAESSVIIDMASHIRKDVQVLTLDTGRLPQETYDVIDRVRLERFIPHAFRADEARSH